MSDLINQKFRQKFNNIVQEKFKVKIRWLVNASPLKQGESMNDGEGDAPECIDDRHKYDHRADVWSFGQVAYNLMMNTTSS